MDQVLGGSRVFGILCLDERRVLIAVFNGFIRRFDRKVELRGRLLGSPLLRTHAPDELPYGQPAALKRQLPTPRMRTIYQIRVVQLRAQRAGKFRHGVGMFVLCRDNGKFVALLDSIREVLHDVEDASGRLGISATTHALAEGMQKALVPRSQFDLQPVA